MIHRILLSLVGWLCLGSLPLLEAGQTAPRPNILFILADDLGWSDTTLFGTTELYRTPNIERLARRGMLFTRAYSASPLCSPTRASILTGLSPARHGITAPHGHLPQELLSAEPGATAASNQKSILPKSATRLKTEYLTLAETLKQAGYATGHFGKWHLGPEPFSPLEHGFDVDLPHWNGPGPAGAYVAPWRFPNFQPDADAPHQHIEDRMASEAVQFMREHQHVPFFLNYWMFSVHAPFDAKSEFIEKYRGLVDPEDEQRCPTYAAMIESMDDAVGTLLDTLDELGIADNTLVIFASDNGGNTYSDIDGEAPTSNRPLRGGKATVYEGGIRGPAVFVWPEQIPAGERSDQVIQSMDYYPTILELLEIPPATGQRFDGVSVVPALRGEKLERDHIFTYFPHSPPVPDWLPPSIVVHRGDWKLIRIFFGGENGSHRWKLFRLPDDIAEEYDLAAEHPEVVSEMDRLIEEFLTETQAVLPLKNPDFDPSTYDASLEGVSRQNRKSPQGSAAKSDGDTLAGWRAIKNCRLSIREKSLWIDCLGPDPHLDHSLGSGLSAGKYYLTLNMSSNVDGAAQVFWSEANTIPKYSEQRSVSLQVEGDSNIRSYTYELDASKPPQSIRLDPLGGPGRVKLKSLELRQADGKTVFRAAYDQIPRSQSSARSRILESSRRQSRPPTPKP